MVGEGWWVRDESGGCHDTTSAIYDSLRQLIVFYDNVNKVILNLL